MAADNAIDLKIVDEGYKITEEDIAKGTKCIYFSKGEKDD